jgi:hypothetical protein
MLISLLHQPSPTSLVPSARMKYEYSMYVSMRVDTAQLYVRSSRYSYRGERGRGRSAEIAILYAKSQIYRATVGIYHRHAPVITRIVNVLR